MELSTLKRSILKAFKPRAGFSAPLMVTALFLVVILAACGGEEKAAKKDAPAATEQAVATEGQQLPEGHPDVPADTGAKMELSPSAHREFKSEKELRLSDEIKAAWKSVNVELTDNSSGSVQLVNLKVGERVKLTDDGFAIELVAFVPEYTIYDDHIGSRSNEPNNPAVLVALYEGDNIAAEGWVFAQLTSFNSYSHLRFALALKEPFTPAK